MHELDITISSYHHPLDMSNEDVFAGFDHQRLHISKPQRRSCHDASQRRRNRVGQELCTYNKVVKNLCRL